MASVGLASLKATLEFEIQQPSPRVGVDDLKQMRSLINNLSTLQVFLKKFHIQAYDDPEIKDVEYKIKRFTFQAEDKIEIQLRNILLAEGGTKRKQDAYCTEIHQILGEIRKEIDELLKIVKKHDGSLADLSKFHSDQENIPSSQFTHRKEEMVGNRQELEEITTQLKRTSKQLQVISIFGMGGIGKTTLITTIYDDPGVTNHFGIRARTLVSQQYEGKQIIISLLRCIKTMTPEEIKNATKDDLADQLQKLLKGKRYLIVVDDVWSIEAWEDIKRCFPTDSIGSYVLLTSRHEEVWLRELIQDVGKEIARQCKGLPLSIVVVAGILSGKVSLDDWKNIQKELALILTVDEQCTKIPALSYKHLPPHLKSCFLHLGVFPEDSEMPIKKLVRLWIAEGFVKVVNVKALKDVKETLGDIEKKLKHMEKTVVEDMDKTLEMDKALKGVDVSLKSMEKTLEDMERTLEDTALDYLQDLISRSMVLVRNRSSNDEIKTCRMHDLLHYFCVNKAEDENLLYVGSMRRFRKVNNLNDDASESNGESVQPPEGFRWLSFWPNYGNIYICYNLDKSRSLSFLHRDAIPTLIGQCLPSNLLRVLDLIELPPLSNGIFMSLRELLLLRYMDIALDDCLSPEELTDIVSKTRNLQTLIVSQNGTSLSSDIRLPSKILESPHLRHVEVSYAVSVDPPSEVKESLHTLNWLSLDHCTEEVFSRIPNIKKLGIICGDNPPANLHNLGNLDKLETLMIAFRKGSPSGLQDLNSLSLHLNIKKLKLKRTSLPWSEINLIGKLPYLQVLKLKEVSKDSKWKASGDAKFAKLQFLYLEASYLDHWDTNEGEQFLSLQRLVLKRCIRLNKIPEGFGNIDTLETIELKNCSPFLLMSAKEISANREMYTNKPIAIPDIDQVEGVEDDDDVSP